MREPSAKRARMNHIIQGLRSALESQQSYTYAELARRCGSSTRPVRNYLDDAESLLGFPVERTRGRDRTVRVRAAPQTPRAQFEELGRQVARSLLRSLFPIAGTALDRAGSPSPVQIVVSTRGVYQYTEAHLRCLRSWIQHAAARPRRLVKFHYDGAGSGPGVRFVWPLGIVIHDATHVYLAGVPDEDTDGRDVRTYALESVGMSSSRNARQQPRLEICDEAGEPPPHLDAARIEEAIDAPFGIFRAFPKDSEKLCVRFAPEVARYVQGRLWHKRQRGRRLPDGRYELHLGLAHKRAIELWLRTWGDAVEVVRSSPKTKRRSR